MLLRRRRRLVKHIVRFVNKNMFHYFKDITFLNNCKSVSFKFLVYVVLISVVIIFVSIPDLLNRSKSSSELRTKHPTDMKYILFWKPSRKNRRNFYKNDVRYKTGQTEFIEQKCPYINCYVTYNKTLLGSKIDFDMIVFNVHDMHYYNIMSTRRTDDQIYVFKSFDSAENHYICRPTVDNFFNWTWTYKLDSDIPHPFFNIIDKKYKIIGPKRNMNWQHSLNETKKYNAVIKKKTKAVACIIRNCQLKDTHASYLNNLHAELAAFNYTMDTFGPCGGKKCPSGSLTQCFKMIENDYYFNLVLEDTFEEDYVSDKVAKAMGITVIPIIRGGSNLTSFLPPGSYMNANAFDIRNTVAVIDYLIKSPEKYSFFMDWKNYYSYTERPKNYICDLCTKLVENNGTHKTYANLRQWWKSDVIETCESKYLYRKFSKL